MDFVRPPSCRPPPGRPELPERPEGPEQGSQAFRSPDRVVDGDQPTLRGGTAPGPTCGDGRRLALDRLEPGVGGPPPGLAGREAGRGPGPAPPPSDVGWHPAAREPAQAPEPDVGVDRQGVAI